MIKNYFKIAWRSLFKNKVYSIINILGLSIGLSACLLIGLYVHHELSYDEFHENSDRIYRVNREFDLPNLKTTIATTPSALAPMLEENLSAVEMAVRIQHADPIVEYKSDKYVETSFIYAEEGFFEMFSFPISHGKALLERPSTVLISESMVTKYFSNENPLGKSLRIANTDMEVTGVFSNVPENSHLKFDLIASMKEPALTWQQNNYSTYLMLKPGYPEENVRAEISSVITDATNHENNRVGNDFIPHLQLITDIHLGQGAPDSITSAGNILFVYFFIALAIFIVLMACINYINISTARSADRAREVGLRKTLGANRFQIAFQFLGESLITTLIALFIALAVSRLALPFINDLAGKSLDFQNFIGGPEIFFIGVFTIWIGIIAGLYPAFLLSRFKPSQVVKGADASGGDFLRKSLVVLQFALSVSLILGTIVVYQQLTFLKSKGLGFNSENVVLIKQANFLGSSAGLLKQEIARGADVEDVAFGFSMPGTFFINSMLTPEKVEAEDQNMNYTFVDFDYVKTLNIEIIAGRDFSREFSTDSSGVLLNETAVRNIGWTPEEAIGKGLNQGSREFKIIGVVKDYNYASLHAGVYPLALFGPISNPRYIAVKIKGNNVASSIERLQTAWNSFSNLPFEYSFLADDLAFQYKSEDQLAKVFGVFTGLAIFVGCLGLFGLAAFSAERRRKEIGIRKVLGASVKNIVLLMSKDFVKLVIIALIIASPVAWYFMNGWLQDFAYRIDIGWVVFAIAGLTAIGIAIITVGFQAIKAAVANPVKSLRSE